MTKKVVNFFGEKSAPRQNPGYAYVVDVVVIVTIQLFFFIFLVLLLQRGRYDNFDRSTEN